MNRYLDLIDPWTRPSRTLDDLWDAEYSQIPFTLEKNNERVEPTPSTLLVATSPLTCRVIQAMVNSQNCPNHFVWANLSQEKRKVFTLIYSQLEGVGPILFGFMVDILETGDLHGIARVLVDSLTVDHWIVLDSMPTYLMGKSSDENVITRYCLSSKLMEESSFRSLLSNILEAPAALTGLSAALMTLLEIRKQRSCTIIVSENQLDDSKPSAFALIVALKGLISWNCPMEFIENGILPQVESNYRYYAKRDSLYL